MTANTQPALPIKQLNFSFICPDDWQQDGLQIACRLRGLIGLSLKKGCCFFDAKNTPCKACEKRPHCHYGQRFETPQNVLVDGFGNMPSLPHAWSLSVNIVGVHVQASFILSGMDIAYETSWKAAIDALPLTITWQTNTNPTMDFQRLWISSTPLRLKLKGKVPNNESELAAAITNSIVAKSRMLAAWHCQPTAQDFLPEPKCSDMQWRDNTRYAFRKQEVQSMGGWLCRIEWPSDIPVSWLPWLQLAYRLGVGKQTSFGLGRFL